MIKLVGKKSQKVCCDNNQFADIHNILLSPIEKITHAIVYFIYSAE